MQAFVPAAAVLTFGLAVYFTNSALDQVVVNGALVRVAMLPGWQVLVAFVAMAALAAGWLSRRSLPRTVTSAPIRLKIAPLTLPAFALALLVVPYLPFLPDWLPALQLPAGPLVWVVWLTVAGLFAWTLWQSRIVRADWVQRLSVAQATVLIGVLSAALLAGAAWVLTSRALSPPSVDLPAVLTPVRDAVGSPALAGALLVIAAIAAALTWRSAMQATGSPGAAMFAWAAVILTAPFLLSAVTVSLEVVAALAVVIAFTYIIEPETWPQGRVAHGLVVGVACATLPWLGMKYAPMSAVLIVIALARGMHADGRAAVAAPFLASLAAWFAFGPSADPGQTGVSNLIAGVPGLLFDQEYGVLAYAPVYILAATGLCVLWRQGGEPRRRAIETTLVFAALVATAGAWHIWWGGTAPPGRPLASGLLLLAPPIAMAARRAPQGTARRAGHQLLLWVSIGVALTLLLAQQGLLVVNTGDGTSAVLAYWSPRWDVWSLAPTFIFHQASIAWLHSLVWLAVAFAAAFALSRWRTRSAGAATLAAMGTFVAALIFIGVVMARLPHHPPLPEANLLARPRLPILDNFDGTARPIGIRYDPLHVTAASTLLPLGAVSVGPGVRVDPQPIRVLHNGRFSLPAGRYQVDVAWADSLTDAVPLGLQIGRIEPAWKTWSVQPQRGTHWETEFDLPVDASFVGFRGTTDLERAIGLLTVRPLAVVDEGMRPRVPMVLAVWQYGSATTLFHDELSSPEAAGFWVFGGETATVTVVRDAAAAPLMLRVHSGQKPNRVTIALRGWEETLTLQPRAPQDITLPDSRRRFVTFEVHPEAGFSPRDYEPASQDPRFLGAWVEILK